VIYHLTTTSSPKTRKIRHQQEICIKLEKELPNSSTQKWFQNLRLAIKNWSGSSRGNNCQGL